MRVTPVRSEIEVHGRCCGLVGAAQARRAVAASRPAAGQPVARLTPEPTATRATVAHLCRAYQRASYTCAQ